MWIGLIYGKPPLSLNNPLFHALNNLRETSCSTHQLVKSVNYAPTKSLNMQQYPSQMLPSCLLFVYSQASEIKRVKFPNVALCKDHTFLFAPNTRVSSASMTVSFGLLGDIHSSVYLV